MISKTIMSRENPRVKYAVSLQSPKGRKENKQFFFKKINSFTYGKGLSNCYKRRN